MTNTNRNELGPVLRHLAEAEPGCLKTLNLNESFYKAFPYMRKGASTTDAIYGRGQSTAGIPNSRSDREPRGGLDIKPGMTVQHTDSGLDVTVLRDWGGIFSVKFPNGQIGMYDAKAFAAAKASKADAGTLAKALAKRLEDDPRFAKALAKALGDPPFGASFKDRIDSLVQKIMALDLAELNAL